MYTAVVYRYLPRSHVNVMYNILSKIILDVYARVLRVHGCWTKEIYQEIMFNSFNLIVLFYNTSRPSYRCIIFGTAYIVNKRCPLNEPCVERGENTCTFRHAHYTYNGIVYKKMCCGTSVLSAYYPTVKYRWNY